MAYKLLTYNISRDVFSDQLTAGGARTTLHAKGFYLIMFCTALMDETHRMRRLRAVPLRLFPRSLLETNIVF